MLTDEEALRSLLADATVGQPAAPVDRVASVRRRYVRRRTTQLGTLAAAVAAVVVGTVLVASPFGNSRTEPANRSVPSWALPWPDHRDGSVSQTVLDQAVSAWRYFHADGYAAVLPAPSKVIWYLGQRAVNGDKITVMFEVDGAEGHRLIAGFADANDVGGNAPAQFDRGSSPWVLYDVPAPSPDYRGFVGLNLTAPGAGSSSAYHNWIVVLTHPSAQQISWSGAGLAGGAGRPDRGLVIADSGQPTGQVYAKVLDRADQTSVVGQQTPVGVPGNPKSTVPYLRPPAPLTGVPHGFRTMGPITAQGSLMNSEMAFHRLGPTTIYARCYGAASMRVAIDTIRSGAGVILPCDNQQHALPGQSLRRNAPTKGHLIAVHAADLVAWTVAVVAG